jgi:transposase
LAPCLVGIEACATAHHWARQIAALGHEVKLMPPTYVKAYVKRNKMVCPGSRREGRPMRHSPPAERTSHVFLWLGRVVAGDGDLHRRC